MKTLVSVALLVSGLTSCLVAQQGLSQGAQRLPPEEFVAVVTGVMELPPGPPIFTLQRDEQRRRTHPRPRIILPAYGATLTNATSNEDQALASSAGLFFNSIFAQVVDLGPEGAARIAATRFNVSVAASADLVAYSETLVYLYRKSFNDKIVTACNELDANIPGMGEANALQVFAAALAAGDLFITQFYLDAFVDLDRQLDPAIAIAAVAEINRMASSMSVGTGRSGSMATTDNWNWINGYCGARRKEQDALTDGDYAGSIPD